MLFAKVFFKILHKLRKIFQLTQFGNNLKGYFKNKHEFLKINQMGFPNYFLTIPP